MPLSLKHKFSSPKVDGPDSTRVQPSNWNDEHDLVMASGRLVGRSSAGEGAASEIPVGNGLVLDTNGLSLGDNPEFEAVQLSSVNGGQLAGLRNKIINGDFRINQRGAATKAQPVQVYGFDRWKGHADGLEQIVEGADVRAGTYTLSWAGGGSGRLNGGGLAVSPITAVLSGGADVSAVVPSTATDVQLERGPVATPFEERFIGLELMLCQRFFWKKADSANVFAEMIAEGQGWRTWRWQNPVQMRETPTITATAGNVGNWAANNPFLESNNPLGGHYRLDVSSPTEYSWINDFSADAEM